MFKDVVDALFPRHEGRRKEGLEKSAYEGTGMLSQCSAKGII